ncbi:MAG: hypothetical protein AAGA54_24690 [Myxococcota bacterium]
MRLRQIRLAPLVGVLCIACASAEKDAEPLDALALCTAQVDEASCNAAEPESDALTTTCDWVEWTRVELNEESGVCELLETTGRCELFVTGSVGCPSRNTEGNCGPTPAHVPLVRDDDDGTFVGFSTAVCENSVWGVTSCDGLDDDHPACACQCDVWPE